MPCDVFRCLEHRQGIANNLRLAVAGEDCETDGEAACLEHPVRQKFIVSGPRRLVGRREIKTRAGISILTRSICFSTALGLTPSRYFSTRSRMDLSSAAGPAGTSSHVGVTETSKAFLESARKRLLEAPARSVDAARSRSSSRELEVRGSHIPESRTAGRSTPPQAMPGMPRRIG